MQLRSAGLLHCVKTDPIAHSLCRPDQGGIGFRTTSVFNFLNILTHSAAQRKDFPSSSFYVVVVVKTEDEACGGPLRFYPLRPDDLIDAGNRTKLLDVLVSPAIDCESHRCSPCWRSGLTDRWDQEVFDVSGSLRPTAGVYVKGMLFCLGIFLSFYLLTLLVACIENKR